MNYKIVTSSSPERLTSDVKRLIDEGWKPFGGHSVVETHRQNRYRGTQHVDTIVEVEYSQTMTR
jgi:hypothetical protein